MPLRRGHTLTGHVLARAGRYAAVSEWLRIEEVVTGEGESRLRCMSYFETPRRGFGYPLAKECRTSNSIPPLEAPRKVRLRTTKAGSLAAATRTRMPHQPETNMPKYLLQVNYTAEGAKGLIKDGGSERRSATQQVVESLGGRLESMYFAFGDTDAYVIVEMPDNASVAAMTVTLAARGATSARTTALLTPEEMDQATRKSLTYRPPGQ
jgi:uncharacterized protein with GYD domain